MAWHASRTNTVGATIRVTHVGATEGGSFLTLQDGRSFYVGQLAISLKELGDADALFVICGPTPTDFLLEVQNGSRRLHLNVAETLPQVSRGARRSWSTSDAPRWVDALGHFIPKQLLEPWFGDLLESRSKMFAAGKSARYVRVATTSQAVFLVLNWLKVLSLDFLERVASGFFRAAR